MEGSGDNGKLCALTEMPSFVWPYVGGVPVRREFRVWFTVLLIRLRSSPIGNRHGVSWWCSRGVFSLNLLPSIHCFSKPTLFISIS